MGRGRRGGKREAERDELKVKELKVEPEAAREEVPEAIVPVVAPVEATSPSFNSVSSNIEELQAQIERLQRQVTDFENQVAGFENQVETLESALASARSKFDVIVRRAAVAAAEPLAEILQYYGGSKASMVQKATQRAAEATEELRF